MVDPMRRIKVVIADDHPLLRMGIRHMLEYSPEISVMGEAQNGQEALEMVRGFQPDVLILDLQMPILDGFQVLKILKQELPALKIIVLSANDNQLLISETLKMGAWDYFLKEEAPILLVDAVHLAARGDGKGVRPDIIRQ
jgi:two-component system, NarL family, invasion response regulator UvrY